MARINLKGGAMLAPLPCALVSCGSMDEPNVLTVAWCGVVSTIPPRVYVSVRPKRHSYVLIRESGEFVINLPPSSLAKATDYCGTFTGRKVNKFEKCGLTPIPSKEVSAPTVAECPVAIECRVSQVLPMGSHDMFIADVVSMSALDTLFDEAGKLHYERADLLSYSHGEYFAIGKKVGKFGFSAAKKKKNTNRTKPKNTEKKYDHYS